MAIGEVGDRPREHCIYIYTIYVHCQKIYNLFVQALETGRKISIWQAFLACFAESAN